MAALFQDVIPVKGRVVDSLGNLLSGASITNISTRKTVMASSNASFSIDANEGDELLFSYIGYKSKSVIVTRAICEPEEWK